MPTSTSRPSPPTRVDALVVAAAAAGLFAARVVPVPTSVALASLVLVAVWRLPVAAASAATVATFLVSLGFLELDRQAASPHAIIALAVLYGAAFLGPLLARRTGGATAGSEEVTREAAQRPGRRPGVEARAPIAADPHEPEAPLEREVTERFLADLRDALEADAVLFWRVVPGMDEPTLLGSAGTAVDDVVTNPPLDALIHLTVQQGTPATNYDTDAGVFIAAPVGRREHFHGALGVYAADRARFASDRAKLLLPRWATRLGALTGMFQDASVSRQYRERAVRVTEAAERILGAKERAALARVVAESALEVSGATRAGFVHWDRESETGRILYATAGLTIDTGFRVASDSLVAVACRGRQRNAFRENYRMSDVRMYGPDEPARRVGSVGVVPLIRDAGVLGAIVVEGAEDAQVRASESDLLFVLAPVAAVALEMVADLERERQHSKHDPLTGLPNRRAFDERLTQHLGESDRHGQPVSLVLLDVDHFKRVNDTHGHAAGDAVLVAVGRAMTNSLRNIDLCARYGGEELAVILPQTPLSAACEVADRLRRAVSAQRVALESGEVLAVTASFGVATYPDSTRTHEALFRAADRALYTAKAAGRNCVRYATLKQAGTNP